jgi:hypothetical protein
MDKSISFQDGVLVQKFVEDVDPILDHNALLRTIPQTRTDGLKHKATIPVAVLYQWMSEAWDAGHALRFGGEEFNELVARKLRDPNYKYLLVDGPSHRVGYGD